MKQRRKDDFPQKKSKRNPLLTYAAGRRAIGMPGVLRNKGLGPDWAQGLLYGNEPPKYKSRSLQSAALTGSPLH